MSADAFVVVNQRARFGKFAPVINAARDYCDLSLILHKLFKEISVERNLPTRKKNAAQLLAEQQKRKDWELGQSLTKGLQRLARGECLVESPAKAKDAEAPTGEGREKRERAMEEPLQEKPMEKMAKVEQQPSAANGEQQPAVAKEEQPSS